MVLKRRAQYMTDGSVDIDWNAALEIEVSEKTLSSGDILVRSVEPLSAEECHKTEQIIDEEYTSHKQ